MMSFNDISDESIVTILEYLRAIDLATLTETNKSVFSQQRISRAIQYHFEFTYPLSFSSPVKAACGGKESAVGLFRCDALYVREVKCILSALSSPQPVNGKGFWISASWLSNTRKYFEALNLPDTDSRKIKKKQSKIRQRRGSDALPPWPSMNADLVCCHGELSLAKVPTAKRRLVDSKVWYFLRKFYPSGPAFKSSKTIECKICSSGDEEAKEIAAEKRVLEISIRKIVLVPEELESLVLRKSGIPSLMSSVKRLGGTSLEDLEFAQSFAAVQGHCLQQPLVPGLYNLVPKAWLKQWRQYIKDPTVTQLKPLDCTSLLCHSHGHLVVPPHVEEYLIGVRKS